VGRSTHGAVLPTPRVLRSRDTFDKRGTGLSDRVADIPPLEQRVDDLRAVMDAAGIAQAALMGVSEGGPLSIQFATIFPARTQALVLYGADARTLWVPDYPWGRTEAEQDARFERVLRTWGRDESENVAIFAPSKVHDPAFIHWFTRYSRASASPAAAVALRRMNRAIDVGPLLEQVDVPTLVINRIGDRAKIICHGWAIRAPSSTRYRRSWNSTSARPRQRQIRSHKRRYMRLASDGWSPD
jgi:pimeloyl-ACP methyl ester carboxylesterase